jgi:hypothetical protein
MFEFKRDMSSESMREAEAQIQRDYAAIVGSKLRPVLPVMFAMVSNGGCFVLYKMYIGDDGLLCMLKSDSFRIATNEALAELAKPNSEWCASFDAGAAAASAAAADAVALAVAFQRIVRHLKNSVDAKMELPTVKTGFVEPVLTLTLPQSEQFANGGTLIVGDVLAVTRRNVVALCEVKVAPNEPAKQFVIKVRMAERASDSVRSEMDGVELVNELLKDFPHQPPKLICSLLDRALVFEHVEGVPISECCTCSAEKRDRLRSLLLRDIAPIRAALNAKDLLYVDWHSGNVLADNADAPTKLFLVDFESVMQKGGQPRRHTPLRQIGMAALSGRANWATIDDNNWKQLLDLFA